MSEHERAAVMEAQRTPDARKRKSESLKASMTPERLAHLHSFSVKPKSEETKAKMRAAQLGKKRGPHKKKRVFHVLSAEHRAKISEGGKLAWRTKRRETSGN